jgi:hypothetical protein
VREEGTVTSVVIAAHNEAAVIGACLDSLLADSASGDLDITVVPNGCTDTTAEVAEARGVRVMEIETASKPAALNAAEAVAVGFPRVYIDADIVVSGADIRNVCRALAKDHVSGAGWLAAVPHRQLDLDGRPWPVRAYFAISSRHPAFQTGLFGRGMIAISEAGHARIDRFPDMVADDLFLDSLFTEAEKVCVDTVVAVVAAPLRTRALVHRLARVRRGNAAMRTAGASGTLGINVRPPQRMAWLRDVVLRQPRLAPAGVAYVVISVVAALLAKRSLEEDTTWERDESTRIRKAPGTASSR